MGLGSRGRGAPGIDLSPVDVTDDEAVRWLETMVWPEQEERRERLRAAVRIARADPPYLVQGDLLDALPALVEQAPPEATLVVFHSAVIAYLEPADRERFAAMMAGLVADGRCHWVSNEGPRVLPGVGAAWASHVPFGRFVLAVDGHAVALTHGHGAALDWLVDACRSVPRQRTPAPRRCGGVRRISYADHGHPR